MRIRKRARRPRENKASAVVKLSDQEQRTIQAFHEAAHAVVAWELGLEVSHIGVGWTVADAIAHGGRAEMDAGTIHALGNPLDLATVALAGLVADEIYEKQARLEMHYEGLHNDANDAAIWLAVEHGVALPSDEHLEAAWRRARDLVINHFAAIKALARVVESDGSIGEAPLMELLGSPRLGSDEQERRSERARERHEAWRLEHRPDWPPLIQTSPGSDSE